MSIDTFDKILFDLVRALNRRARLRKIMPSIDATIKDCLLKIAIINYGNPGASITFKSDGSVLCTGTVVRFEDDHVETNKICVVRVSGGLCGDREVYLSNSVMVVNHE